MDIEGRLAGTVGNVLEDQSDRHRRSAANGNPRFSRIIHGDLLSTLPVIDLLDVMGTAALIGQVRLGPAIACIIEGDAPLFRGAVLQPYGDDDVAAFSLHSRQGETDGGHLLGGEGGRWGHWGYWGRWGWEG